MKMSNKWSKKLLLLRPEKIMQPLFPINEPSDAFDLKPLADSILANGIIEPLIVRKNAFKRFELVSGGRRLRAAMTVGLRRVPCVLITADELSAALISVSENLNRRSPDYFKQAQMLSKISVRFGIGYEELSEKIGMSLSVLINRINLLSLKEPVKEKLLLSGLDEKYAMTVSMVPEDKQLEFIEKILSFSLTPQKATEAMQDYIFKPLTSSAESDDPSSGRKAASYDVRIFTNSLSKLIKTLNSSGIRASSSAVEKEDFIEYTIKVPKPKHNIRHPFTPANQINPVCSFVP